MTAQLQLKLTTCPDAASLRSLPGKPGQALGGDDRANGLTEYRQALARRFGITGREAGYFRGADYCLSGRAMGTGQTRGAGGWRYKEART
jgi:hypothetical protein